jgi:hypothetical protein
MDQPNRPQGVQISQPIPNQTYDSDAIKSAITKNNASPIGALLVGADEFLSSEAVHVKINAGNGLTFEATNELGAKYQFTATGQFDLNGKVVSSS